MLQLHNTKLYNDKRIYYKIMEQLYNTKLQNMIKILMIKLCNNYIIQNNVISLKHVS
jgi:hypothetical protein